MGYSFGKKRLSQMLAGLLLVSSLAPNAELYAMEKRENIIQPEVQITTNGAYEIGQTTTQGMYDILPVTTGSTYYIDSIEGNDENQGVTPEKPWKSLDKLNQQLLQPGDTVLLKKGSVFDNQQLYPKGSGSEENPILISSYGESGDKPLINANGKYRAGILIENMEHCIVEQLEVTNDDDFTTNNKGTNIRRLGIHVTIDERSETIKEGQKEYKDITIRDCYIHDVDGDENRGTNKVNGGIGVEVFFHPDNQVYPRFNGVTIDSNLIKNVERTGIKGVRISGLHAPGAENDLPTKPEREIRSSGLRKHDQGVLNFVVTNNRLENIGGDGILIDSSIDAKIERNVLYNHSMTSKLANAGIWAWNSIGATFRYNESYGGPIWNQDGCSYDADFLCAGTVFEYNYSHDTPMGFMLLMGSNETDVIRYNISQNDGMAWRDFCWAPATTGYVYNNIFYYDGAKWNWSDRTPIQSNYEFYNNIFYNYNDQVSTKWQSVSGQKVNWDVVKAGNNMVYEASGEYGDNEIPNAFHDDPQFVLPGGGKTEDWESLESYKLKETSPAINKGIPVTIDTSRNKDMARKSYDITQDFFGNPLYKGRPDIGVYEHQKDVVMPPIEIEGNGTYSLLNAENNKYLSFDGNKLLFDKSNAQQEFILATAQGGYKIKVHDGKEDKVKYMTAQDDGNITLSQENLGDKQIWKIEDLSNGFVKILSKADENQAIARYEDGIKLVKENDSASEQWYLDLKQKSLSINVGGPHIEGYSQDREWNEETGSLGRYGTDMTAKDVADFTGEEEVYNTAIEGETIGYKVAVPNGIYAVKLNFFDNEYGMDERVFDIIINDEIYKEKYDIQKEVDGKGIEEISFVSPKDGYIDIQLKAAYNQSGTKNQAILNGISINKSVTSQVDMLLNSGSNEEVDGLKKDRPFDENGSGYYGDSNVVSFGNASDAADAGLNSVVKSGREGADFGYQFKVVPAKYRVKLVFHDREEAQEGDRVFDIYVNDECVKQDFDIVKEAGARNTVAIITIPVEQKGGILDIKFKGKNGKQALVNGVIVEPLSEIETRENIALNKPVTAQHEANTNKKGAAFAVDGKMATRWATGASGKNGSWIQVDLGKNYLVDKIVLDWVFGAYATSYKIQISKDQQDWEDVKVVNQATPGLNIIKVEPMEGRYIRVTGNKTSSEWGMSLCEFEVYGVESTGALDTDIQVLPLEGNNHQVTIGLKNTYKRYTTVKAVLDYDPESLSIVEEQLDINPLVIYKSKNDDKENGHVEYLFEIASKEAFDKMDEFMKVQVKTNGSQKVKMDIKLSLTVPTGHITELPTKEIFFSPIITKEFLRQFIEEVKGFVNQVTVGDKIGMYTQETVDQFKQYIEEVERRCEIEEITKEELEELYKELETKFEIFKTDTIKAKYQVYYKDYSVEELQPQYTGQGFTIGDIVDNALNVKLEPQAQAINQECQPLQDGIFRIKFSVDNIDDQLRFKVRQGETDKIEVTIDQDKVSQKTLWAWGGATGENTRWGYFDNPNQAKLEVNKVHELKIVMKTIGEKTQLTVWLDDILVGEVEKAFSIVPGSFSIETRNAAKNLKIYDILYTDAPVYKIKVNTGNNGSIKESGTIVEDQTIEVYGEMNKTLFLQPDAGYEVDKLLVDGELKEVKNNRYTFEEINQNHVLDVTFKPIEKVKGSYTVLYKDEQNNLLLPVKEIKDIPLGMYIEKALTIDGYEILGETEQTIYLTEEQPQGSIEFVYRKIIEAEGISLNKTKIELKVGEQETLLATIHPEMAVNKDLIWETSDENIVSVIDGKVLAKKVGEATVTVKTTNNKKATCQVSVVEQNVQKPDDSNSDTDDNSVSRPKPQHNQQKLDKNEGNQNLTYIDIIKTAWYYNAVEYVLNYNMMAGVTERLFDPQGYVTRGQIIEILYNLEGMPDISLTDFKDISMTDKYAKAVTWAQKNEIIKGYEDGTFKANDNVTREQLMTILYRYMHYRNEDRVKVLDNLSRFVDGNQLSSYAKEAGQWAIGEKIIQGRSSNLLAPKEFVSRAELATILMRFNENYNLTLKTSLY